MKITKAVNSFCKSGSGTSDKCYREVTKNFKPGMLGAKLCSLGTESVNAWKVTRKWLPSKIFCESEWRVSGKWKRDVTVGRQPRAHVLREAAICRPRGRLPLSSCLRQSTADRFLFPHIKRHGLLTERPGLPDVRKLWTALYSPSTLCVSML